MNTKHSHPQGAQVISLAASRKPEPQSTDALLMLARYRAAWLRANPNATVEEDLAAGAQIAKELGL